MRPPRLIYCLLILLTTFQISSSFSPPTEDVFRTLFPVQPPHCTKTPIVIAHASTNANAAIVRDMQMQFYIGLHTTVCFRLEEELGGGDGRNASSWLHTIRLDRLEHHHPVTQRYQFAIPEVKAECICECDANSNVCSAETYKYTQCPEQDYDDQLTSCYRTFFPNQAPSGCGANTNPKLCCDLKFRPYRNQTYTAVKLEQPSTFATFVYTAYDYSNGRWMEKDRSTIRSQLDGGTQDRFLDVLRRISLSVSAGGRASHQLDSGMYFANSNPGGEMDELRRQPLNEISENDFDRLGWYRMDERGRFHVNNGVVRLDKIHNAKATDCKSQTYKSILDANNYMPGAFNLSRPLEMTYPWIQSARIYDGSMRQVIVTHAEGTNLHITLQVNTGEGNRLIFFHNASLVDDFTGTIIVDSRSNRYFNLTVYGASGKINGAVKYSTTRDSDEIYTFTTYVHDLSASNRSMIIPLPAVVEGGARMICLRADEQMDDKSICRIIQYHESPLEIDMEQNTWHEMVGRCPTCNQINLGGIVKYLNPMSWIQGVSSIGDFFMMATDVLVYVCVIVVIYIVLTKILLPCCFHCVCPMSSCIYKLYSKNEEEPKADKRKKKKQPDYEDVV